MAITLQQAQEHLDAWLLADLKLSRGQIARVGDSRIDRSDAGQVDRQINYWRAEVARLEREADGGGSMSIGVATFPLRAGKRV